MKSASHSTQRPGGKAEKLPQARALAFWPDYGELWPTFSLERSVIADRLGFPPSGYGHRKTELDFKELPTSSHNYYSSEIVIY